MNIPKLDIEHLTTRLEPILAHVLKEGSSFAEQLESELSKKASTGLVGTAINVARSLGKATWKTIRSSRAKKRFQQRWNAASKTSERQNAIRQLLIEDPKRAALLNGLLLRFDFVRAVAEHAEHLPNMSLLDSTRRLSDVYVPLRIEPIARPLDASSQGSDTREVAQSERMTAEAATFERLLAGNHLIEGIPGSGKSTIARWLAASIARLVLNTEPVAFDRNRLPLLVSAQSLQSAQSDFASALRQAAAHEMSFAGLGILPDDFFLPYSKDGHKSWFIIVDGLDEIDDQHQRQRLWAALSELHSQVGDAFRFAIFTRPNAVRIGAASTFQRWRVCLPSEADRKLLALRYISSATKANNFITQLTTTSLVEITRVPLFEAIAASLFDQTGHIPSTQTGVCEAFASALIRKSHASALDRTAILRLLESFALDARPDLLPTEVIRELIPSHTPKLEIRSQLEEIAKSTGILQMIDGRVSFIHDVFRSYFSALRISRLTEPGDTTWSSIDPFRFGWTTIQYICECWWLQGRDISVPVQALLSFGDNGEACATELSISCPAIDDKIPTEIVDRIFREMYSTGPTISGVAALTRLASQRPSVKERLLTTVYSRNDFLSARLECAESLLRAGHLDEAIDALEFIATGEDEYCGDRVRAAQLLLEAGRNAPALRTLLEMAEDADMLSVRANAASILFVNDRSDENRELVADLLRMNADDDYDSVDEEAIARLLSAGEEDLALPIIRERAEPPLQTDTLSSLPRTQIAACRTIALHHDRAEALAALNALLDSQHVSLRGKAEVIEAIADLGVEEDARSRLQYLIGGGPDYPGTDWFVLEMLDRLGLRKELEAVGIYLLRLALNDSHSGVDAGEIVARLADRLDRTQLSQLIEASIDRTREPRLAINLAVLGMREKAIQLLLDWLNATDTTLKVEAAKAISAIGERFLGLRALVRIVKDAEQTFETRLSAVEALDRINESKAAERAYRRLIRDTSVSIEQRCIAARRLDEHHPRCSESTWDVLFPLFLDRDVALSERITIGEALLRLTQSEWFEFDEEDILDELFSALESKNTLPTDAWAIIGVLAEQHLSLTEIPRAAALVEDPTAPTKDRIELLKKFVLWSEDELASRKLIELAQTQDLALYEQIEALSHADLRTGTTARDALIDISKNGHIPPTWRLQAASAGSHSRQKNEHTTQILLDDKISVNVRVFALRELRLSPDQKILLLSKIAETKGLNNWDRLLIVDDAINLGATDLACRLLDDVAADAPLSIAELTDIGKAFRAIGDHERASYFLKEVLRSPDIVIVNCEDQQPILEAAESLAQIGSAEHSVRFLHKVLRLIDTHTLPEALNALERIAGESDAQQAASEILPNLVREAHDPKEVYMDSWRSLFEQFLSKGWNSDLAPLLAVASNPSRRLRDRGEAAHLIYKYASCDRSADWRSKAKKLLVDLLNTRDAPIDALVDLIQIARSCDLKPQALRVFEEISALTSLKSEDYRALAGLAYEIGDREEAKRLLEQVPPEDESAILLAPWDERIIREIQGDDRLKRMRTARALDERVPVVDRLFDARDVALEDGNRRAIQLIFDTACNQRLNPNERLHAIEVLEELGFRQIPTDLLPSVLDHEDVDDFWAGDIVLRLRSKKEALERFRRAIKTCPPEYRDQIARKLADLQAVRLLEELDDAP